MVHTPLDFLDDMPLNKSDHSHLTKLGREIPDVPCTVFFEDAEWKALVGFVNKNPLVPEEPPSLGEAMRMVAGLGGFLGRKCDGDPGTKSIWLGLQRLDDITAAYKVFVLGHPPSILLGPTAGVELDYGAG